jgi:hypothetical protein
MLFLIPSVLSQPQLCSKPTEYSQCTNEAHLAMADCSSASVEPNRSLYACLCDAHQQLMTCYSICPDDPNLQLQRVSVEQNMDSSCKAVLGFAEVLTASPTVTTSTPASTTSTLVSPMTTMSDVQNTSTATVRERQNSGTNPANATQNQSPEPTRRQLNPNDRPSFANSESIIALDVFLMFFVLLF